jgi:hypothetical protein
MPRICWQTIFICGKPQRYDKPLKQLGLLSRQANIRRVTGASSVNLRQAVERGGVPTMPAPITPTRFAPIPFAPIGGIRPSPPRIDRDLSGHRPRKGMSPRLRPYIQSAIRERRRGAGAVERGGLENLIVMAPNGAECRTAVNVMGWCPWVAASSRLFGHVPRGLGPKLGPDCAPVAG